MISFIIYSVVPCVGFTFLPWNINSRKVDLLLNHALKKKNINKSFQFVTKQMPLFRSVYFEKAFKRLLVQKKNQHRRPWFLRCLEKGTRSKGAVRVSHRLGDGRAGSVAPSVGKAERKAWKEDWEDRKKGQTAIWMMMSSGLWNRTLSPSTRERELERPQTLGSSSLVFSDVPRSICSGISQESDLPILPPTYLLIPFIF